MSLMMRAELLHRHAERRGDLVVVRRPAELRLELLHRPLDLARPGPQAARREVHAPQLVDHLAADVRDREGLELVAERGVEARDGREQPLQAPLHEVLGVDVRRQAAAEPPRDVLHQRRVGQDQPLAGALVARRAVAAPDRVDLAGLGHRRARAYAALDRGLLDLPLHSHLQPQDGLRVQLRDAGLGHAEHLADLAQGQLLVVVERDHELLAVGQALDGVGQGLAQLRRRHLARRILGVRVLDHVDQGHRVAARARDLPELVERGDRGARDRRQGVLELAPP